MNKRSGAFSLGVSLLVFAFTVLWLGLTVKCTINMFMSFFTIKNVALTFISFFVYPLMYGVFVKANTKMQWLDKHDLIHTELLFSCAVKVMLVVIALAFGFLSIHIPLFIFVSFLAFKYIIKI